MILNPFLFFVFRIPLSFLLGFYVTQVYFLLCLGAKSLGQSVTHLPSEGCNHTMGVTLSYSCFNKSQYCRLSFYLSFYSSIYSSYWLISCLNFSFFPYLAIVLLLLILKKKLSLGKKTKIRHRKYVGYSLWNNKIKWTSIL